MESKKFPLALLSVIFFIYHLILLVIISFYRPIFSLFRTYFCRAYFVIKSWRNVVHDHLCDLNANVKRVGEYELISLLGVQLRKHSSYILFIRKKTKTISQTVLILSKHSSVFESLINPFK